MPREGVTFLQALAIVAAGLETEADVLSARFLVITAVGSSGEVWGNLHLGKGSIH